MGGRFGRRGLVLGKFLPPHAGHTYLVEFAAAGVEALAVVVGTLPTEPIPGALRVAWMRELFPQVEIIHLDEVLPQAPDEHPEFWGLWRRALTRVLPWPVDVVFASEAYGPRLAAELSARYVPVDPARLAVPIRATAIRERPLDHFEHLPPPVRAHYARRVSVFGPESTGKTTLALRLAAHYRTTWVPEFARAYLEAQGGALAPVDLDAIARGQRLAEDLLARRANRLLVTDTDPLLTVVWSEVLFGRVSPAIAEAAHGEAGRPRSGRAGGYALTLLLDIDTPFVPDAVRYLPERRAEFFAACRAALAAVGRPFVVLSGGLEARLAAAIEAIDRVLEAP